MSCVKRSVAPRRMLDADEPSENRLLNCTSTDCPVFERAVDGSELGIPKDRWRASDEVLVVRSFVGRNCFACLL